MDIRAKLLHAAAQVYAETGYRGATTRRIAQEAGVNEITLFRHFGSKDALIQEALGCSAGKAELRHLPEIPVDPERELGDWCRAHFDHLYAIRSLIRKVMGEIEEHPEIIRFAESGSGESACEIARYVTRLKERGLALPDVDASAAAAMLMGAVFAEAMGRDVMKTMYRSTVEETLSAYVKMFVRAIGARPAHTDRAAGDVRATHD